MAVVRKNFSWTNSISSAFLMNCVRIDRIRVKNEKNE
jgi:hypothetical protein